jgi:hypothetical protein
MICPPNRGFEPLSPTYFVTLLFHTLVTVGRDELVAFSTRPIPL